jgi:acyl-CoA synthetase (NDP forming)
MMVLKPSLYEPDRQDSLSRARLSLNDVMRLEIESDHKAALHVAHQIMKRYKLTAEKIEAELDVGGVDWSKAGSTTIDLSFL